MSWRRYQNCSKNKKLSAVYLYTAWNTLTKNTHNTKKIPFRVFIFLCFVFRGRLWRLNANNISVSAGLLYFWGWVSTRWWAKRKDTKKTWKERNWEFNAIVRNKSAVGLGLIICVYICENLAESWISLELLTFYTTLLGLWLIVNYCEISENETITILNTIFSIR